MGQITVTVAGRTHRLACDDGQEAYALELVERVRAVADRLEHEHGDPGGERLLLMAAILLADEVEALREAAHAEPADDGTGEASPGESMFAQVRPEW